MDHSYDTAAGGRRPTLEASPCWKSVAVTNFPVSEKQRRKLTIPGQARWMDRWAGRRDRWLFATHGLWFVCYFCDRRSRIGVAIQVSSGLTTLRLQLDCLYLSGTSDTASRGGQVDVARGHLISAAAGINSATARLLLIVRSP